MRTIRRPRSRWLAAAAMTLALFRSASGSETRDAALGSAS